jgi:acetylornithine deacetylase/succinyl-diaminopimelate desuccinylase-like protein
VPPDTYDQKHIDPIGKLKNCIANGPGILKLAHKPDEYIGIGDIDRQRKDYGAGVERYFAAVRCFAP